MHPGMVSVIIPALNEEQTLGPLLKILTAQPGINEIILVDDGSRDKTTEVARKANVEVVKHPYPMGNGAAIKTGIRHCRGDLLVFLDADGQHDPSDIEKLLDKLDTYDMVVGARAGGDQASGFRRFGNWLLNRIAGYVTGFDIRDLTSGFRAVRAEVARNFLPLLPNGYSWPTTITLAALRSGFSIKYIPLKIHMRVRGKSQLRPFSGAFRFLMILLKICTLYSPLRIFVPVSVASFFLGLCNYVYTYWTAGRFTNMSALLFATSVIIFMIGLVSEQVSQIGFNRQQPINGKKDSNRQ